MMHNRNLFILVIAMALVAVVAIVGISSLGKTVVVDENAPNLPSLDAKTDTTEIPKEATDAMSTQSPATNVPVETETVATAKPTATPVSATKAPVSTEEKAIEAQTAPPTETSNSSTQATSTEPTVEATEEPVMPKAFLLVTACGQVYQPIPLYEEGEFVLQQKETGAENVIHVTEDSVWMASSSCENQDCVLQGTVTLDNMEERILGNMIICLPNQVSLELYTPEGLLKAFGIE